MTLSEESSTPNEDIHKFDVCFHCGFASCSCFAHFPRECPNCARDKFTGRAVIKAKVAL